MGVNRKGEWREGGDESKERVGDELPIFIRSVVLAYF